jgi:hypothetical protein
VLSQDQGVVFFACATEKFENDYKEKRGDTGDSELGVRVDVPGLG